MLNEFRDCCATNLKELGKAQCAEMNIKLLDDEPVTYRLHRLAHSEREKVRNIVKDLYDDCTRFRFTIRKSDTFS